MESVHDIKEALSARSRTATLDELANEGRKKVRLIRAEHVAAMISEAVHSAIEQSGLIEPQAAEKLVEKSRQEFRTILREREEEQQRAQANEAMLAQRERELIEVQERLAELSQALASTKQELATAAQDLLASKQELQGCQLALNATEQELATTRRELASSRGECEQAHSAAAAANALAATAAARASAAQADCAAAVADAAAARGAFAAANAAAAAAPPAPSAGPSSDLLLSLVSEMATLKANLLHAQAQARPEPVAAPQPAMPDFASALEKLTGSLNDRLESLGKKMGVSAAVSGDAPVDFAGMFKDTGKDLESNMDNIEVKQKAGGGIAGNLARLKKLKGGG